MSFASKARATTFCYPVATGATAEPAPTACWRARPLPASALSAVRPSTLPRRSASPFLSVALVTFAERLAAGPHMLPIHLLLLTCPALALSGECSYRKARHPVHKHVLSQHPMNRNMLSQHPMSQNVLSQHLLMVVLTQHCPVWQSQ